MIEKLVTQSNLCADYHAAVEKVLAALANFSESENTPSEFQKVNSTLSELSAVHEKAKGLL